MRIELVSTGSDGGPNWIDVRDTLKGRDIFAVREASEVPLGEDGRPAKMSFQKLEDDQLIALSAQVITGWSFQGVPVPSSRPSPADALACARGVLGDLEAADLRKFRAEMKPLLDEVKNDEQADPTAPATS